MHRGLVLALGGAASPMEDGSSKPCGRQQQVDARLQACDCGAVSEHSGKENGASSHPPAMLGMRLRTSAAGERRGRGEWQSEQR